jgi:flavin-dependent dehydrogenase
MKNIVLIVLCLLATTAQAQYDLVIVGGTPGGIMAAIAAAKQGKTSVILERTAHIGGLPANGLGATDIATRGATTGLFAEFIARVKKHYVTTYGEGSKQVKDCSEGFHFEPNVGESVLEQMLAEQKNITVLTARITKPKNTKEKYFSTPPTKATLAQQRKCRSGWVVKAKMSLAK